MLKKGEKLSRNRNEGEKGEEAMQGAQKCVHRPLLLSDCMFRRIKHKCCSVVLQQLCCFQFHRNESWSCREEKGVTGAAGRPFELDLEPD